MSKIKFGVCIPTFAGAGGFAHDCPCYENVSWGTTKTSVLECERLGYHSVWMADHLILGKEGAVLECWTTLSALASLTERVKLGTLVTCNSYRYPSLLAKMAATLDVISKGRLDLGIGAGWKEDEYRAYGIPWYDTATRIEQMREGIKVIKSLWTEERPSYVGKYYKIENAVCEPKPVQMPHPPIWIGGGGERLMLRVVAELADGWNLSEPNYLDVKTYKHKLEVLEKHCSNVGRDFKEIEKSLDSHVIISLENEEIDKKVRCFKSVHPAFRHLTVKEYKKNCLVGTPDECVNRVQEYVDLGVTQFTLWFLDYPSRDGIRLFAEEVMPLFR